jgi:hypothetical protein
MPPRWATVAIIAFWLIAMAWMTVREIVPRMHVGGPPPYVIDLTDEVSAQEVNWDVYRATNGERIGEAKPIGEAKSSVRRRADRTFELHSHLLCKQFPPFESLKLDSIYKLDADRSLLEFNVSGTVELAVIGPVELIISGRVEDGYVAPELRLQGQPQVFRLEKAKIPGSILNSLHLLNRISGLAEGQNWSIPLIDPLQFLNGAPGRGIPRLDAAVGAASLPWDHHEVLCFLIEYREPGKDKVTARTWVRRSDGIVLQHAATHGVTELLLVRRPTR